MEEKVLAYRRKHPKCKYCKYLKYHSRFNLGVYYYKCEAKNKVIRDISPDMTCFPRWFCSCYEVDKEK